MTSYEKILDKIGKPRDKMNKQQKSIYDKSRIIQKEFLEVVEKFLTGKADPEGFMLNKETIKKISITFQAVSEFKMSFFVGIITQVKQEKVRNTLMEMYENYLEQEMENMRLIKEDLSTQTTESITASLHIEKAGNLNEVN